MKGRFFIIGFFIFFSSLLAMDFKGEVENELKLYKNDDLSLISSGKFEVFEEGENFYSQITLKGIYGGVEEELYIDRLFTEFYKENFSLGIGRQRLSIGVGHLFNVLDVRSKRGVDSLKLTYNIGSSRKIELA